MIPSLDLQPISAKAERANVEASVAAHPDLYLSAFTQNIFEAWFAAEAKRAGVGSLPLTLWNLEVAYNDLATRGLLPQAPSPVPGAPATFKLPDVAGIAQIPPSADEKEVLAKLTDDWSLSDHARKQRDRKLALLAGRQRRELSNLPGKPSREYPEGSDPAIRI